MRPICAPIATLMLAATLATAAGASPPPPSAEPPKSQPTVVNLSVGGAYYAGNLDQLQLNTRSYIGYSADPFGNDTIINGFRIYSRFSDGADFKRVADDLSVINVPFWYVHEKFYVFSTQSYAWSQSHLIDARLGLSLGAGYTPIRERQFLMRFAVSGVLDYADYDSETFSRDVEHDGDIRLVPRASLFSNGWYRIKGAPVSLRWLVWVQPSVLDADDFRVRADVNVNIPIYGPIALSWAVLYQYESVTAATVEPDDLRTTFGITWRARYDQD